MSQAKAQTTTAILWEELSDADLMAVTGGDLVGGLLGGVANVNNAIGNGGTPTTGLIGLGADTLGGAANYLKKVNGGVEGGLENANAIVSGTAGQI